MSIGTSTNVSTGRGGAGNIGSPKLKPTEGGNDANLTTPHLKSSIYTTGRGGQGNMAKFEADEARKAQDVDPVLRRQGKLGSTVMTGRGGGGNAYRVRESGHCENDECREGRKERRGSILDMAKGSLDKIRTRSGSARRVVQRKASTSTRGSASSG